MRTEAQVTMMDRTMKALVGIALSLLLIGCGGATPPSTPPMPAIVADLARVAPPLGTAATVTFQIQRNGSPKGLWTVEFPLRVNDAGAAETAMEVRVDALMASKGHPKDPVNGYPESLQAGGPIDSATGIADWTYLVVVDGLGPDGYPNGPSASGLSPTASAPGK